ncbi:MAG: hypothetical protein ACJ76S_13935 [Solirubrobacteraceae bacterium]
MPRAPASPRHPVERARSCASRRARHGSTWLAIALAAVSAGPVAAARADASAPRLPRSYLVAFSDQLGVPGNPAGAAVTPGGHVYTGWGELAPSVGAGRDFDPRTHTVDGGRIPILHMFRVTDGTLYSLTLFEASVLGNPVVFARIDAGNLRSRVNRARISASFGYDDSDQTPRIRTCCIQSYRFPRARIPPRDGLYLQPGVRFSPRFRYALSGRALLRDGRVVLVYPPAGSARKRQLLRTGAAMDVDTQWGPTSYDFRLPPHGRRSLDLRMPVIPVVAGSAAYRAIAGAPFDVYRAQVRHYYNRLFGAGIGLSLPERKVSDTFYASIANIALPRYLANGAWVQAVNNMRYHAFWLRDGAMIAHAFDLAGLRGLAAQDIGYFLSWQQPDGLFISRPQEYDGFGQALWAIGEHYRLTRDAAFARRMYPPVRRAMAWFEAQRGQNAGLMPAATSSTDNDLVPGHLTGDNFWAAAGASGAVDIAKAVGDRAAAAGWAADLGDLRNTIRRRIASIAPRGPIPPALDHPGGQVWGILWASYIGGVYPARSLVVRNTIRRARRAFSEGILTYLDHRLLHHYSGFRVFETDLLANRQADVVKGLYAELAHTTSTNAGWEAATSPFGDRLIDDATTPHGWWAAEYVTLVRNMLVREQGRDVYLMSALSPSWLRPGRRIGVRLAPTAHGRVSFRLSAIAGGAVLSWTARLRPGTRLRWPVPYAARGVRAPGLGFGGRVITLPGRSGRIVVRWRLAGASPTYGQAFERLMRAYERSPNGATAHAARLAREADARRAGQPFDLDRYVPPQLAAAGGG